MNLIERLGGYEAAKANIRELASDYDEGVTGKTKLYDFPFNVGQVEQALLEYRRQHNIFEVGDKVVFTDILNSCVVTFESTETDPMQIVWLTYPDGTAGYVFHLNKIKHATDEEIKAGKRLEVKSEN